jgi:carnitine 3-dehydrogenase
VSEPAATVGRVGLLGAGVIGGGWAARFLLSGVDVVLHDPDPDAERKVGEMLENARRSWSRLTMAPLPELGSLTVVDDVEHAVSEVDFVQESAPEQEQLKRELLARASMAAAPDTVFASSTSGLLPSRLQIDMAHPERLVVGHPFNPVYLLPLVEVCPGDKTAPAAVDRAVEVYRWLGMSPLLLKREIDGFIADRLLEALWREALWLVADDVATVSEVDDALRLGPGLRWSFMGSFMSYRLGGGELGMRHFLDQFGPTLKWPWTKLTDVPELTEELTERIVAESDAQAAGRSARELERHRDDCLVAVLHALRTEGTGAGGVLREWELRLVERAGGTAAASSAAEQDGLLVHRAVVLPEWADYNGHAHESRLAQVFGDATDALLAAIGIDAAYVEAGGSYYTVETHLSLRREALVGQRLRVTTQLLGSDDKRLHVFHSLYRVDDGELLATAEQMLIHVDARAGRAAPAPGELQARVAELTARHSAMPAPNGVGRRIALPG